MASSTNVRFSTSVSGHTSIFSPRTITDSEPVSSPDRKELFPLFFPGHTGHAHRNTSKQEPNRQYIKKQLDILSLDILQKGSSSINTGEASEKKGKDFLLSSVSIEETETA
jgi:hypothetical protein